MVNEGAKDRASRPATEPQAAQLSRAQLRRLLGITEHQLRSWERNGWVEPLPAAAPRENSAAKPGYSFAEVAALRTILRLRRSGVPTRRLRALRTALRAQINAAGVSRAWTDLQIQSQGRGFSISYQGTRLEPLTGQLLLDFNAEHQQQKVQAIAAGRRNLPSSEAERRARADRFFLAGLRYEERAETLPKAIRAYQKAAELNPNALGAFINLGTIFYHQGSHPEAERCYRAALVLNPRSALVHFNLANLLEEQGQLEAARDHYEKAIELDPIYSDPRFNLALIYERLGRHGKACQQWRGYLRLDPDSRWGAYARQKLEQISLRVVPSSDSQRPRP
jgi:tetratricopeptide (TPR) repeat protein